MSAKKSITYKSRLLEVNSQHKVFVSYVEDGPELFAVQLVNDAKKLQDMMLDINRRPHSNLAEPPMIGTVCLGRMKGDNIIARAIVMNLSRTDCKLFFVDFGDTEMVSYYDIFDIPEEFVKPNIFAMRICLSGVKKLEKSTHLNQTFKQLVLGQIFTLRVVPPEGPPLIQYGELFLENKNVFDLLMANMKDTTKLQFKWMEMLPLGSRQSILVSYVDSCIKFYVQLSDKIDELNAVMDAVKAHCENSCSPGGLPVGAVCCARFPDDDNWYRAIVRDTKGNKIVVGYVDYGNEQEVSVEDLRTITPDLIQFPAQAMKCALKGFENRPVETKTSNQLEMIALEKTLMAHVVGVLSNDTMIVTLVDDTDNPPLDVARRMNQLSQPRSVEPKAATPVWKEPPETFSSPEGSVPDESRKKSFRREKEKRCPKDGEDFGQRGGSFRDRRGPPRARENHAAAPPGTDEWEESPASAEPPRDSRPARDYTRDRRGPPRARENHAAAPPGTDEWEESPASAEPPRDSRPARDYTRDRYQCIFQDCVDDQYKVSLWNMADMLVETQLAIMSESQSSLTPKDEAIDLTFIVGQQILSRVTHVESFEKFYVQLDLDKADLVESAIADFDVTKLTPLVAEYLTKEFHCMVKHDGKIYRAILNDVSDPASVQALLPDYGNVITTSIDNLMMLPSELYVYYYQALVCCLNNYTAESKTLLTLDELKSKLIGNKFIIYVNDIDEITVVSTLYDPVTGQKIGIFEPDEAIYDEVVQLCTRAAFNYNFGNAYISHIESLNEFYLQKAPDGDRIALLLEELYKFYEEGTPEPIESVEVDALCAAKSADGNWYRATVISSEEEQVKVQFSDYGYSETVAKDTIKKLDPKFFEPCCLALVASLGLIAIQDDAITKLTEWTTEEEVQVTLAFGSDGWLASLHLDGVDLSAKLINEKLAAPHVTTEQVQEDHTPGEAPVEEPISLPEGCSQVYITHIDSPGQFWLQMLDKAEKIDEVQAELQTSAESYADIDTREMGTLCVAKYSVDEQWYRAEILDSDSDIITIRFIDYGNTDVLDNQPGLLKVIPDLLKDIERYAIKASVNAIPTGTGQWSEPASDYFTQLVGDLSAPVDALVVLKDVTTYVDIFVNGQNLTDKLVSEGHATRSEESECGNYPSCFASHVNSPSEFWIQLESAAPELQSMETAMVDAENFPELTSKEEGVLCAAKYPEDGAWYRAQVIVDGSEGTEVLFMDYGNASIVSELRSLPEELQSKPALSRKCALQKPPHVKAWSRKSEVKFNELAAEGATIFNVQFVAAGDISIVDLFLEGKSVSDDLAALCKENPPSERPAPIGQDLHSSGKICYLNSLEVFYMRLDDSSANLDKVTERLSNAEDFEAVGELKVGSIYAAFWSVDEKWYRAKILDCNVGYHVQFIDYGNKAKCKDFRQLPEDIAELEPLAKCCRLSAKDKNSKMDLLVRLLLNDTDIGCILKSDSPVPNAEIEGRLLLNDTDIGYILKSDSPVPNAEIEGIVEQNEQVKEMVTQQIEQHVENNGTDIGCILKSDSPVSNTENEGIDEQKEQVKEMVTQQIEQLVENAVEYKEVKESIVQQDKPVTEVVVEQKELIEEIIVEQKALVEESIVEQKELVKESIVEQDELVKEVIVIQKEPDEESIVEQKDLVEECIGEQKELIKESIVEQKDLVEECLGEQKELVKESIVELDEPVNEVIVEQTEQVEESIVEQKDLVKESVVEQKEQTQKFVTEQIEQLIDNVVIQREEKEVIENTDEFHDAENEIGDANDLELSNQDLNESVVSTNMVIQKSFAENDVSISIATSEETATSLNDKKISTSDKEVSPVKESLTPLEESKTSSPKKE